MSKIIRSITFLLVSLILVNVNSQVVINEYSCANSTNAGHSDSFGEREDWVELYNTTGAAVNLAGYSISDKASNPTKFQIPNISIPANGYMMVYASGRAQIAGGSEIHTSFKLTQTKFEKIILSNAGGTIIDSLTIIQLNYFILEVERLMGLLHGACLRHLLQVQQITTQN